MSMHRLEEMTWMETDDLEREKTIVWIPISPIEEHGPHLPLGTDLFGAKDMAEMAASLLAEKDKTLQSLLLPAIPLGSCKTTADFPGTLSVRGTTLASVVKDVCETLCQHGFRYMVVANHHLDPVHMKAILSSIDEVGDQYPDVRIIEILSRMFYGGPETEEKRFGRSMGLNMDFEIHADVCETSYIRHRYPELFKRPAAGLPPVLIDVRKELRKGPKTFKQMGAEMGYIGSPEAASEALGQLHMKENARLAASLAFKLVRGEALPPIPQKMKTFFDQHVHLD